MATNIPPHNLGELVSATLLVLENPATTIDEIMQVMPGPDFPTGGIICGTRGVQRSVPHWQRQNHAARRHPHRRDGWRQTEAGS